LQDWCCLRLQAREIGCALPASELTELAVLHHPLLLHLTAGLTVLMLCLTVLLLLQLMVQLVPLAAVAALTAGPRPA
jgi:hypothetical protein